MRSRGLATILVPLSVLAALSHCASTDLSTSRIAAPAAETVEENGATPSPAEAIAARFSLAVLPILETRCQPCHFAGGQMYDKLPFDQAETTVLLGEKLFTRIRDEGEQAAIRSFLESAVGPVGQP